MFDRTPDPVLVHAGGAVLYANAACEAYLGATSGALAGRRVDEIVHREDRQRFEGAVTRSELRLLRADGEAVHAELTHVPVIWDGVDARATIARDASARRQMEARLVLVDRLASIGTIAAGVAHELNNAIAYIVANLGFAQEALGRAAPVWPAQDRESLSSVQDAVGDAHAGAERVRAIVTDLKGFSRTAEDRREPVDVRRVLESSIRIAWSEVRQRARLVKDFEEVPKVAATEGRLGQVFLNLLLNAVQAIPAGAPDANEIRVVARAEGARGHERVVVEIRDTGTGVAPEVQARMFEPFVTSKRGGTGLGLSICHAIVSSLGGDVSFVPRKGGGTVFRVALPVAEISAQEPPRTAAEPAPSSRRGAVLVVDDEPMIGAAMRRALSRWEVTIKASAIEALELLESGACFDAILCDVMMPGMTGVELVEAIARSSPETAGRVILVTGGAYAPGVRQRMAELPNPVLEKPFEARALVDLVSRVAEQAAGARDKQMVR